jgi:dsDNA-specific endonuclease/ATPase MutS2
MEKIMTTTAERLGIVETKVENLNGKMDELKVDLKDVHDCLDRTRDDLTEKLDKMYNASCTQHSALSAEISNLKKEKDKVVWFFDTVFESDHLLRFGCLNNLKN